MNLCIFRFVNLIFIFSDNSFKFGYINCKIKMSVIFEFKPWKFRLLSTINIFQYFFNIVWNITYQISTRFSSKIGINGSHFKFWTIFGTGNDVCVIRFARNGSRMYKRFAGLCLEGVFLQYFVDGYVYFSIFCQYQKNA